MTNSLWQSTLHELREWRPENERDRLAHADAVQAIDTTAEASLRKADTTTHFTASAFVFDHQLELVALCYHRKGQFWVQPGGHLEAGDPSIVAAAMRELVEETGISAAAVNLAGVSDLDSHALGDGFGACGRHLDFGVAAVVRSAELPPLAVSDESEDLMWARVAELPTNCAAGLDERITLIRDRLRAAAAPEESASDPA